MHKIGKVLCGKYKQDSKKRPSLISKQVNFATRK